MGKLKKTILKMAGLAAALGFLSLEPVQKQLSVWIDIWSIEIQQNGLLVLTVAAVIVALLLITLLAFRIGSQRRNRDVNELMRVARQNADLASRALKAQTPIDPADIVEEHNGADLLIADTVTTSKPKLTVISGGKDQAHQEPNFEPISPAPRLLSPELYFRPVLTMPEGTLAGYDVYRKDLSCGQFGGSFVQIPSDLPRSEQAEFERSMVELTLSTMRQSMDLEIGAATGRRLHVLITSALIDDDRCWNRTAETLRAHKDAAEGLCLCVSSDAFTKGNAALFKERMAKVSKLIGLNVEFNLAGMPAADLALKNHHFDMFSAFSCDLKAMLGVDDTHSEASRKRRLALLSRIHRNKLAVHCQHVITEADVVDGLTAGSTFMSGDYFCVPRALKSAVSDDRKQASK